MRCLVMGRTFQRARRPEQKAQQRERIVVAARSFLEQAEHSSELSLADVANLAGMARSNVYRYFDSREDILLAILGAEIALWIQDVIERLATAEGDLDSRLLHLAVTIDEATAPRPLLCHLVSVLPGLLDTTRGNDPADPFISDMQRLRERLTQAMTQAVPELTEAEHFDLMRHVTSFIIGAWPLSASARTSGTTLGYREKPGFQKELRRAVLVVARGILG
ncbi:MAG: TetR/AcrR family transcriptional regulator [Myxococcota bacterium]